MKLGGWDESRPSFFANKTVLVTGGTGFIGKLLIRWLVTEVPDIAKIYVLARENPRKGGGRAEDRLHGEILASPVFDAMREKRDEFDQWVGKKVTIVYADLMKVGLGLEQGMRQMLIDQVQILIHMAASSDWKESLETSFRCNVVASVELMGLAQRMGRLGMFLYISSAFFMGRPMNASKIEERIYPLLFDAEVLYRRLCNVQTEREMARQWAKLQPTFQTTHSFTKSLAEVLLVKRRQRVPLVIVRPTILGATYREPFPGWVDSLGVVGGLFIYASLGMVHLLHGHPEYTLDIVPCDYVVHAIVSIIAKLGEGAAGGQGQFGSITDQVPIFHISSSSSNPLSWKFATSTMLRYWRGVLPIKSIESPHIEVCRNYYLYQAKLLLRHKIPASYYTLMTRMGADDRYRLRAERSSNFASRTQKVASELASLIGFDWKFDTTNTDRLRRQLVRSDVLTIAQSNVNIDTDEWNEIQLSRNFTHFNWNDLDWTYYIYHHCWGLLKFVLYQDVDKPDQRQLNCDRHASVDLNGRNSPGIWFKDWRFCCIPLRNVTYPSVSQLHMINECVLNSGRVRAVMEKMTADGVMPEEMLQAKAKQIIERIAANQQKKYIQVYSWIFRKLWRHMYQRIDVNENAVCNLLSCVKQGPVILVPSHRSYIDFLVTCFALFGYGLPVPMTAAGEDFLNMSFVSTMLRLGGAFFLRRSFRDDALYGAIFSEYVRQLVIHSIPIQFFIEGMRSRSGKMLHPKQGMLKCITDCYLDGEVEEVVLCPISINYERVLEDVAYTNEWMGQRKKKETLKNLVKASSILVQNYGRISIKFAQPIHLSLYVLQHALTKRSPPQFDPFNQPADRKALNFALSYRIIRDISQQITWSPLSVTSSALLSLKPDVSKVDVALRVAWIIGEIVKRKFGYKDWISEHGSEQIMQRALDSFPCGITQREASVALTDERSALVIVFYKNQMLHLFARDAYIMASYLTLSLGQPTTWIPFSRLKSQAEFLSQLIGWEFIHKVHPGVREELDQNFSIYFQRHWLERSSGFLSDHVRLGPSESAADAFSYFPSLIVSIIDCYWVMTLAVTAIRPDQVEPRAWLQTVYEITDRLYADQKLNSLESCSREMIRNAMHALLTLKVLEIQQPSNTISVGSHYASGDRLFVFFQQVTACRWTKSMLLEQSHKNISLAQRTTNYLSDIHPHKSKL